MAKGGVQFFDLPVAPSPWEISARIARLDDDVSRAVHTLAFRVPKAFLEAFQESKASDARSDALLRAGTSRRIVFNHFDSTSQQFQAAQILQDGFLQLSRQEVEEFRRLELAEVIFDNAEHCFLTSTYDFHLEAPSGRHCTRFLRVADAFRSVSAIRTVAYWLSEIVANSDAILIDTYGIASPVLMAAQTIGRSPRLEILPGYPTLFQRETEELLGALFAELHDDGTLTTLVSVNSTGTLVARLDEIVTRVGGKPRRSFVSLYQFADFAAQGNSLCVLDEPAENRTADECTECIAGTSEAIPIDSQIYSYRERHESTVFVNAKRFKEPRSFLERWKEVETAFRVHRDDRNDHRHHAFDIDVGRLLQYERFGAQYLAKVDSVSHPPTAIIAPDHETGRRMAAIAADRWRGCSIIVHGNLRTDLSLPDREALDSATHVLVVDDVLNSGSRLDKYNKALREDFRHFRHVSFLVGIARPESAREWETHRKQLTENHSWSAELLAVDSLFLPRWRKEQCPWCKEFEILSAFSQRFARPPQWLTDRLYLLSERPDGISEPLLLLSDDDGLRTGAGAQLGENLSPILAIFSVAAALQSLRCGEKNDHLTHSGLAPRLLDERVLELYSETLIRALFLRAADPREWSKGSRGRIRKGLLNDQQDALVLGELLVAGNRHPELTMSRRELTAALRTYTDWDSETSERILDGMVFVERASSDNEQSTSTLQRSTISRLALGARQLLSSFLRK